MTRSDPSKTRVGRVRRPTRMEVADPDAILRADAVLALTRDATELTDLVDPPLSVLERHVADLVDGYRPVARIKKKGGLATIDVVMALRALRKRELLKLVGVVEEAGETLAEFRESVDTVPRGTSDVIPPHIMNEIAGMLIEEQTLRAAETTAASTQRDLSAIDDDTD